VPSHFGAQFELVVRRAKAKFVTGLSATVARKDGHHPIIFMQCGPVRHRVDAKAQAASRPFTHEVFVRPTNFRSPGPLEANPRLEFHQLYEALRTDDARNRMICADIVASIRDGRSPLVLTERTEHLFALAQRLSPDVSHVILLQGGLGRKALAAALTRLEEVSAQEGCVILATGKYVGEGFDHPRLDTLFLTLRSRGVER
jgi:superfamily II DNA or RNA helicase